MRQPKYKKCLLGTAIVLATCSVPAQATLTDYGYGLVIDSALSFAWAKDANLFLTLATKSGNASSFVNTVISANGGQVSDGGTGTHTLNPTEFDTTTGQLDWWAAQAFIGYLNNIDYLGHTTWTLPSVTPLNIGGLSYNGSTDFGYNNSSTSSYLAYLYNAELANPNLYLNQSTPAHNSSWTGIADPNFTNAANGQPDAFTNLASGLYWTGTEYSNYLHDAWAFDTSQGLQFNENKTTLFYAWLGATAVPETSTTWMLSLGLLTMLGFKHRSLRSKAI